MGLSASRRFISVVTLLGGAFMAAAAQTGAPPTNGADMDAVVHALCGKSVALLGESPVHGFGKTLEFKVELVRRLVDECHYNAFFIEGGTYDFIHIEKKLRSGQTVTDAMISAAIGGLWANKEVQSLVPFLREKVNAGSLTLGGLDDQLNKDTYAQNEMPADLVSYLQGDERARCLAVLQRHTLWQYSDDAPYGPADKARIVGCLDAIEAQIPQPAGNAATPTEGDRAMVDSLKRNFARNFTEDDFSKSDQVLRWMNDRERSMYVNFAWWQARLPRHSKIIVWAATVHTAKDVSKIAEFTGRLPLGSYLRRDFGDRAFSLGFSAFSGSYVMVRPPVRQLSDAPATSLEGRAFAGRTAASVYLSQKQLRSFGPIASRPLGTTFSTARWDEVLDGLVVFRAERPPELLAH